MKSIDKIIDRPFITEKTMALAKQNKYTFRVFPDANKIEIRDAIQQAFNVRVLKVNVIRVSGKTKAMRYRRFREGRTADYKKAIVTVAPGQRIPIFEGL
jgi:large subunit ribosomal protein L23